MVQDATPERDHDGAGKLDDFHRSISQSAGSRSLINYKTILSSYWITEGRIARLKSVKTCSERILCEFPAKRDRSALPDDSRSDSVSRCCKRVRREEKTCLLVNGTSDAGAPDSTP